MTDDQTNEISGDAVVAYPLFHNGKGGSTPTSPLQFDIGQIDAYRAVELNRKWHSHMPEYRYGASIWHHVKIAYGAHFDGKYYAAAIWSKPNARNLPQDTVLELRRMAICSDAPKNTASRMIRIMVADIKKRYPKIQRVISYQDTAVHKGTIYKASGWKAAAYSDAYDWQLHGDKQRKWHRPDKLHMNPKIRWEKDVR